jgi:hypothetical protein
MGERSRYRGLAGIMGEISGYRVAVRIQGEQPRYRWRSQDTRDQ